MIKLVCIPALAASVANPVHSECPAYILDASSPLACRTIALTTTATPCANNGLSPAT